MADHPLKKVSLTARIRGRVQGVGFRYHTQIEASRLGLQGWVRNLPNGDVEVCIAGQPSNIFLMKQWLQHGPTHASVEHVEFSTVPESNLHGFSIHD